MKPDRARAIEQLLARMAQSGQLRGRVSEDQLIDVLDQVRARPLCRVWNAFMRGRERYSQNSLRGEISTGRGYGEGSERRNRVQVGEQDHSKSPASAGRLPTFFLEVQSPAR